MVSIGQVEFGLFVSHAKSSLPCRFAHFLRPQQFHSLASKTSLHLFRREVFDSRRLLTSAPVLSRGVVSA